MPKKPSKLLRVLLLKNCFSYAIAFFIIVVVILVYFSAGKYELKAENLVTSSKLREAQLGCDLFSGKWVFDNVSYPLYSEGQCSFMSEEFACEKFGRKNLKYQNWRWQPFGCNLPRFNGTALLERLRGKRLIFVGDSINRDQWVSMVCLLDSVIPDLTHKSIKYNASLYTFKALDYNASVEFYWAPLLVESNSDHPVNHRLPERIVRVESITKHARHWTGADILIFDSYIWWKRDQMTVLWGSFDSEDGIYKEVEMLRAYRMALRTWSDWLEAHIDPARTQLFWVSMSPTHFWGNEWGKDSNQNCYGETEPITREGYWGIGSDTRMMKAVEETIVSLRSRGLQVQLLNITQLSEYRKDGHPSIHRKQWEPLTKEQISNPCSYADCMHWCLPGIPDTWNEILYAMFLDEKQI